MDKNYKIVFANQKGGVGKTTLCMLFANYLASQNKPVCVVDTDLQRSIFTQRNDDLRGLGRDPQNLTEEQKQHIPYLVQTFSLKDPKMVQQMMESISGTPGYFLFDAPGSINEEGLVQLFALSDFIVCPYQYEKKTINSTGIFIEVVNELKDHIQGMHTEMFFVPNKYDSRSGTLRELQSYMQTDDLFKKFGQVTPRIPQHIGLTRIDSLSNTSDQVKDCRAAFDYLIRNMR